MTFDDLEKMTNNPTRALIAYFNYLDTTVDKDLVGTFNGTTDPFTFFMDSVVGTNSVFLSRLSDAVSSGYLVHARNVTDLSQHMSDEDWQGVLGGPSGTTLLYIISMEEVRKYAQDYTYVDNELVNFYKKVVIPKDTIFKTPAGDFWLGHAVEIRVMEHGGVQVLYDTTQSDVFADLGTNYPIKNIRELAGIEFLSIQLPVKQVSIREIPNKASNDVVGFSLTESYTDKLYRIRAFITPWGQSQRIEMTVVYNRTNYDPLYPTLVIDLLDNNQFKAVIPSVYLQNGLGTGNVTLLVYTTKGEMSVDLTTVSEKYYQAEYYNYGNDKGTLGKYEEAFRRIDNVKVQAFTPITGGHNGLNFQDLKDLMIYGHRRRDIPISPTDLTQTLKSAGYTTIKAIDYPNDRLYRVSNTLPVQSNKTYETNDAIKINSTIGIYMGSVLNSLQEIVDLGIAKDNGKRITILPGSVIDVSTATAEFYSQLTTNQLLSSSIKNKADTSLAKTLVAVPYYYVLDTTSDQARVRAYYLQNPKIIEQLFFYENPYLGITLGVSQGSIGITNNGSQYVIDIVTTSSDRYKELPDDMVGIQMGINVGKEGAKTLRGFLVGKNSAKERKWRFIIDTEFDIDADNQIYFTNFNQYGEKANKITSALSQRVSFIFTYRGDNTKEKSTADSHIDQSLFDTVQTAIVETEFTVEFGKYLNHLYTAIRPMISSDQYEKYTVNVPAVYEENEYKYENGKLVIENGKAVMIHAKGDVIYNSDGSPSYLHRINDIVYNSEDQPVLKKPREILYYWDFLGLDYNYYLTQDQYDIEYRNSIIETIAYTIMNQLDNLVPNKLQRTTILYKPKSTIGYTNVILNEGVNVDVKNDLRFVITFYFTHDGYLDPNLRSTITPATHNVINNILKNDYVSSSNCVTPLQALSRDEIMEVKVRIYSDDRNVDVISNTDSTNRFGIRKKLVITADNFLSVKEDIELIFRDHSAKKATS